VPGRGVRSLGEAAFRPRALRRRGRARLARALHVVTVALLAALAWHANLSWIYALSIAIAAALLLWEHSLVSPRDLSRVNVAFFTVNGWIGVGLLIGLVLDLALPAGNR
jgi:4-hydroxybenzoate polyprenyltransferase